jgi:hypothetical protein
MTDHLFNDVPVLTQSCRICGRQFTFPKPDRGRYPRFCSDKCRTDGDRLSRSKWSVANYVKEPFVCWWCGKFSQRYGSTKCCSKEHSANLKAELRKLRPNQSGQHSMITKECRACGDSFECRSDNDRYICSDDCRATWTRLKGPAPSFSMYRRHKGIWEPITFEHLYPKHNFSSGKVRRMRIKITSVGKVNLLAVLDRDGWVCQMCGKDTPESLRGSTHPLAPEVDHIVPISRGGRHVYENLQCACRKCNGSKGSNMNYSMISAY